MITAMMSVDHCTEALHTLTHFILRTPCEVGAPVVPRFTVTEPEELAKDMARKQQCQVLNVGSLAPELMLPPHATASGDNTLLPSSDSDENNEDP